MNLTSKIFKGAAVAAVVAAALVSCQNKYFENELYRKEIYIVSGDNNIAGQEFSFGGDRGYVSVYAGGVLGIDKELAITLAHDYEAIAEYNKRNFDQDFDKYALELPQHNYSIENKTVKLNPESGLPYALCPIDITIDDLLPDETYFIPLRIESASGCMVSLSKRYVLLQVFMKNAYATTKKSTYYTMNGVSLEGSVDAGGEFTAAKPPVVIHGSKLLVPLSENSVRILPAARVTSKIREINDWSIRVAVEDDIVEFPVLDGDGLPTDKFYRMQKVSIQPYSDSENAIRIQEIEGSPCAYDPVTKTFHLDYRYKLSSESSWFEMSEKIINNNY